jgi:hypothetical protein
MNGIAFLYHIHKLFLPCLLVAPVDLIPDSLKDLNSFAIFQAPDVLIQTAKILEECLLEGHSPFSAIECTIWEALVTNSLLGLTRLNSDTGLLFVVVRSYKMG